MYSPRSGTAARTHPPPPSPASAHSTSCPSTAGRVATVTSTSSTASTHLAPGPAAGCSPATSPHKPPATGAWSTSTSLLPPERASPGGRGSTSPDVPCAELLEVTTAGVILRDGPDRLKVGAASSERSRLLEMFAVTHGVASSPAVIWRPTGAGGPGFADGARE